jgi:hypothetical protein
MAANAWTMYDKFFEYMGEEIHNLETDTIMCALFLSTSDCGTSSETDYSGLTNEHANANGYSTGGEELTGPVISESGGTTTFDCTGDAVWTASGGSIVCRFAVIYNASAPSTDLICFTTLDNTPLDVTVTDGNTLTVSLHASGIFTIS